VQHGDEDGRLDCKFEAAIGKKFLQNARQPVSRQRRSNSKGGPMRLQPSAGTLPSSIRDRIIER
jgi:hypothetical protein